MYCRKCGKEINDTSKFCPYCGCGIKAERISTSERTDTPKTGKAVKNKGTRKWGIPVALGIGIVAIGTVTILGVKALTKPSEEIKTDVVKTQEEQSDKTPAKEAAKESDMEQSDEVSAYPGTIELDSQVKSRVSQFLWILGNADCKMCGGNVGQGLKTHEETYITYSFLYMTLYKSVPFANGEAVEPQNVDNYTWHVSEDIVNSYLQNSLNSSDYLYMQDSEYAPVKSENGIVYVMGFDPQSMWSVGEPVIDTAIALSENEIELKGTIPYTYMNDSRNSSFDIVMTANPDSMWGYTLKEIKNWSFEGEYLLPDVASCNYTEDELSDMDAHTLYLARNEIYARHGYKFNNQDLKDYFGGKSWYMATTTVVPDTDFNEYEKANLELILALEAKVNGK